MAPGKKTDDRTKPVTEQILFEAARIYDSRDGDEDERKDLKSYAAFLSKQDAFTKHLPGDLLDRALNMRPPRDRITCLLIGNHSAGKSSFVNWYVGDKIQNESVAIETAGITIVRRGKQRTTWKGPQTINAFPYLEKLAKIDGVTDFITTEFSLSTEKNFPLVEFIDTPGLTDGTLKYPFDVDQAIYELAEHATMIMVFLDPIGKALVSRCMNVVEKLAYTHAAKMTYYLTKFDTAGNEVDRTNVVSQIVQELQGRMKATHALKLHTMYLPERATEEIQKTVPNSIKDLCQNISKEIDSRVQDVLDGLNRDCSALSKIVDSKVERNKKCVSHNSFATVWKGLLFFTGTAIISILAYWAILNHAELDPMNVCGADEQLVIYFGDWGKRVCGVDCGGVLNIERVQVSMQTLPDGTVVKVREQWVGCPRMVVASSGQMPFHLCPLRIESEVDVQETKDGKVNTNLYCVMLKGGGGIPAVVGLVLALVLVFYFWMTKTKQVEQLSSDEMKRLKEIQADINNNIAKKHKNLKKRLTEDALDDALS